MTTAPIALRAEVLDQAGQAWGLAGDPVRAYAAAETAVALQPNDPELLIDRAAAAAPRRPLDDPDGADLGAGAIGVGSALAARRRPGPPQFSPGRSSAFIC